MGVGPWDAISLLNICKSGLEHPNRGHITAGAPKCPLWSDNVDHHPFEFTGKPPKRSQIFLAFRGRCRLDWDIEMEHGPSAETYHAEARPDNIQSPLSIRRGNKACRLWRICTVGVEYLHSANGSRVKGGRYFDIARGFVYKTKVLWAQQIVQPLQLAILYSASAWFLLFFVLIG